MGDAQLNDFDEEHPRQLIPALLRQFYSLGWVTGTGGGISMKKGNEIFIAPSGVHKERVKPEHLFVVDATTDATVCTPRNLKKSDCTPLFMACYKRRGAGAVIHSHSKHAVLATLLFDDNFRISHVEMIKGIWNPAKNRNHYFEEELKVPIIENTRFEHELEESFSECLEKNPEASAILVRRHGFYVWGRDWKQAKAMCECYDYLFEMAAMMKTHGLLKS